MDLHLVLDVLCLLQTEPPTQNRKKASKMSKNQDFQ